MENKDGYLSLDGNLPLYLTDALVSRSNFSPCEHKRNCIKIYDKKTKDGAQGRLIKRVFFLSIIPLLQFVWDTHTHISLHPIIYHLWFYSHRFHPSWPLARSGSPLVSFSVCTCTVCIQELVHGYKKVCRRAVQFIMWNIQGTGCFSFLHWKVRCGVSRMARGQTNTPGRLSLLQNVLVSRCMCSIIHTDCLNLIYFFFMTVNSMKHQRHCLLSAFKRLFL